MEKPILNHIFLLLAFFVTAACSSNSDKSKVAAADSNIVSENKDTIVRIETYQCPKITYKLVAINSTAERNDIIDRYKNDTTLGPAYRKALRTLNRKELRFIKVGDSIIVPDSIVSDMRAYSIFPYEYPGANYLHKVILIDNEYQSYGCYEYGKLVRFAAANTGKERTPTFPGRYSLVWKQRLRLSSLDSTWKMPFTFNFHQYAGNAMHQFSMPGRPVSHSCVRQFEDDAEWIYSWGEKAIYDDTTKAYFPHSGTPVIILNMFDYSRSKGGPWLELTSNQAYFIELPEAPMEVEEALIPWCQIPKSSRGVIPNKERYMNAEEELRARGIIRPNTVLTASVDFNLERRKKAKAKEEKELEEKKLLEQQVPQAIITPVVPEPVIE